MKSKQFTVRVGEGWEGKRANHTLFSMTERNVIRSCIERGVPGNRACLGKFSCDWFIECALSGEGEREAVGGGENLKRMWSPLETASHLIPQGALEHELYQRWSHREAGEVILYIPVSALHCLGAPWAGGGIRSALTNPKWLGAVFPEKEAAVSLEWLSPRTWGWMCWPVRGIWVGNQPHLL